MDKVHFFCLRVRWLLWETQKFAVQGQLVCFGQVKVAVPFNRRTVKPLFLAGVLKRRLDWRDVGANGRSVRVGGYSEGR